MRVSRLPGRSAAVAVTATASTELSTAITAASLITMQR